MENPIQTLGHVLLAAIKRLQRCCGLRGKIYIDLLGNEGWSLFMNAAGVENFLTSFFPPSRARDDFFLIRSGAVRVLQLEGLDRAGDEDVLHLVRRL